MFELTPTFYFGQLSCSPVVGQKSVLRYIQHVMFVSGRRDLTDHISAG